MKTWQNVVYWIFCILSLGMLGLSKIVIQKAIEDASN